MEKIRSILISYFYCERCKGYSNHNSLHFHCQICDVCVEGYDHHCNVLNKCVGKYNFISFIMAIVTTFFMQFFLIVAFVPVISGAIKQDA